MALLPIKLPSGFYRNGTDYEQSNRWRDGSLVRWRDGSLRPVGGWRDRVIGQTEYGPQIVANDDYIVDDIWDLQAGWTISGEQAIFDQLVLTFDAGDAAVVDVATDTITINGHNLDNGDAVLYTAPVHPAYDLGGLTSASSYFVVNATTNTFQLSATSGGAAINLTQSNNITFDGNDATVVDTTNDKIIAANTFADGDEVLYVNGGGVDIGGLTNNTNYFVINATATEFQLSTTSGGVPITLTDNYVVAIDSTDVAVVDTTNDKIVIANTFSDGDEVEYSSAGGTDIGGLVDGTSYFIINATASEFQLSATSGGAAIVLSAVGVGPDDHTFRLDIGSAHNLETDIQSGHTFTCTSIKSLEQTIPSADLVASHKYHIEIDIAANSGGFTVESNYFSTLSVAASDTSTQYINFTTPNSLTDLTLTITPTALSDSLAINQVRMRKVNSPRAIHTWESLDNSAWIATGSYSNLYATTSGGLTYDITPYSLQEGLEDAQLGSGYGSGFFGFGGYGQPRQNQGVYSEATTWSLDNFGEVLVACSYDDGKLYDWELDTQIGSDVVTNGTFATDSDWTKGANWTISGGTGNFATGAVNAIEQSVTTTASKVYEVSIRLIASDLTTDPKAVIKLVGDTTSTVLLNDTIRTGDHTFRVDVDDTACTLSVEPESASTEDFTIDNITVKEQPIANQIANAPIDNLGLVVTEERFLVALGAGGNPRKVQWCDREGRTTWAPAATNEAGDIELQTTGQIMQAVRTRGQTLVITDVDAHAMRYLGPPYVYGFERVGTSCGAVSRKAAADVDMGIFWMGQGGFYRFDGNSVSEIPCEVRDYIFDDFNTGQQSKIWAYANSEFSEIWWYYPSSSSIEIDRYVGYNYKENFWIIGNMSRTCGASRGVFRYPILGDSFGTLYDHEVGVAKDGAVVYAETGPISLGNGDQTMQVMQVIPDEVTQGDVDMYFKTRFHPNDVERTYGPYNPANPTSARFQGRQIRMKVQEDRLTNWRVGIMRLDVVARGRR
jgi:hypothetical protein